MFYKGREFCLGYLDADQYYYENEDTDNTSIPSKILDYSLTGPSSNSKFKTNPSLSVHSLVQSLDFAISTNISLSLMIQTMAMHHSYNSMDATMFMMLMNHAKG